MSVSFPSTKPNCDSLNFRRRTRASKSFCRTKMFLWRNLDYWKFWEYLKQNLASDILKTSSILYFCVTFSDYVTQLTCTKQILWYLIIAWISYVHYFTSLMSNGIITCNAWWESSSSFIITLYACMYVCTGIYNSLVSFLQFMSNNLFFGVGPSTSTVAVVKADEPCSQSFPCRSFCKCCGSVGWLQCF